MEDDRSGERGFSEAGETKGVVDKDSKESVSAPPPENLAPLKECLRITVNGFCGVGDRTPLVSEDNNKGSSSGSCWVLPGDWGVEHEW